MALRYWTESPSFPIKIVQENQPAPLPKPAACSGIWAGQTNQRSPRPARDPQWCNTHFVYLSESCQSKQERKTSKWKQNSNREELTFPGFFICSRAEDGNLAALELALWLWFYIFFSLKTPPHPHHYQHYPIEVQWTHFESEISSLMGIGFPVELDSFTTNLCSINIA